MKFCKQKRGNNTNCQKKKSLIQHGGGLIIQKKGYSELKLNFSMNLDYYP